MRSFLSALALMLASSATAQDLQGNDTASNWRVKHFETFGIYLSSCDERMEKDALRQRCYIRYVDVFSPQPSFGALFFFIVNGEDGPEIDFGLETGTLFGRNGFRIEDDEGDPIWKTRRIGCLTGLSCQFFGEAAAELLQAMQDGAVFRFSFRDTHGNAQDLTWPLDGFSDALADFRAESEKRGL